MTLQTDVRLYDRRKCMKRSLGIKFVLVIAICMMIFGSVIVRRNVAQADPIREKIYTSVQIRKGDSLWSIAERYCASTSGSVISEYVDELVQINGIGNRNLLRAGSYLTVFYYE